MTEQNQEPDTLAADDRRRFGLVAMIPLLIVLGVVAMGVVWLIVR